LGCLWWLYMDPNDYFSVCIISKPRDQTAKYV
jgi:hypothetical protein